MHIPAANQAPIIPTPGQTGPGGVPTLPGSGRRPRRRPVLVFPGLSLGLGPGSRYFGRWKNSGALGEAEARWPGGTGPANSCLPGGQEHGAQRSVPGPGNEVFALLGRTRTGQCPGRGPPATRLLTGFVFGSAPFDLGHAPGLDTGAGSAFRAPSVWVDRATPPAGAGRARWR